MVIEEPAAPEEPVESQSAASETPSPDKDHGPRPRPRSVTTEPHSDSTEQETPEPTQDLAVPALEPRESPQHEIALRRQIQTLQEDVRGRLARINEAKLSEVDRKTLEDARSFSAQSNRAMEDGDLQRALNLARKASLLVTALEQ